MFHTSLHYTVWPLISKCACFNVATTYIFALMKFIALIVAVSLFSGKYVINCRNFLLQLADSDSCVTFLDNP